MRAANFAAVAADIRSERADERMSRADQLRHWRECIAEVERSHQWPGLSKQANAVCQWINGAQFSDYDMAAICCALFRDLERNSHVPHVRSAMAGLCDIAEDFGGGA